MGWGNFRIFKRIQILRPWEKHSILSRFSLLHCIMRALWIDSKRQKRREAHGLSAHSKRQKFSAQFSNLNGHSERLVRPSTLLQYRPPLSEPSLTVILYIYKLLSSSSLPFHARSFGLFFRTEERGEFGRHEGIQEERHTLVCSLLINRLCCRERA